MGAPSDLVGVVIDGQEHQRLAGQVQWLEECGYFFLTKGTFNELSHFRADKTNLIVKLLELVVGEVLEGEADDVVVKPVRGFQQGNVRLPQQTVLVTENHRVHPAQLGAAALREASKAATQKREEELRSEMTGTRQSTTNISSPFLSRVSQMGIEGPGAEGGRAARCLQHVTG